jgi:hypothetical protein
MPRRALQCNAGERLGEALCWENDKIANLPPTQNIPENDALLTTAEAARFLGMSVAFLERDRWAGKQFGGGPLIPYRRIGARAVRYRRGDLIAHLEKGLNA